MNFNLGEAFRILLSSNDNNVIQNTSNMIIAQYNNPQFIFHLFELLKDPNVENNTSFFVQIQLTILNNIRLKWEGHFDPAQPIYWTPEIQSQIALHILNLAFSYPNDKRSNFIEALTIIIQKTYPNVLWLMHGLIEIYSTRASNIFDSNTFLLISKVWSLTGHDRRIAVGNSGLTEEVEKMDALIMNFIFQLLPQALENLNAEAACVLSCNAIQIIRSAATRINNILQYQAFSQTLFQLIQLIVLNTNDVNILRIKSQVLKFINRLNSTFLTNTEGKHKNKGEIWLNFAKVYREQILPAVVSNIVQQLSLPSNFSLDLHTMDVFYQVLLYGVCDTAIFTPDFILNVLFKYSRVEPEEVEQTIINPEMYISTYTKIDLVDKMYIPRTFCAMIIEVAVMKMGLHEQIYPLLVSPSNNVFEFEAKLYLLRKYIKSVFKLETKKRSQLLKKKGKKAAKNLPPIEPHIRSEEFQAILSSLDNPNPPFLQVSLIMLCISVLKRTDPLLGLKMAERIITTSELPIFIHCGAHMFNSCAANLEELPDGLNIPALIQKTLIAVPIFSDVVCPNIISRLCQQDSEKLSTYGGELIGILFNLAVEHYSEDTCEKFDQGGDEILNTIYNIIASFPDDAPILVPIMNLVHNQSKAILSVESFQSQDKIYDLICLLNMKLTHNNPMQLDMLDFLLHHWSTNDYFAMYGMRTCQILYPLITGVDRVMNSPELLAPIVKLTESMLTKTNNNEDVYDEDSFGYSLFLASCLIQVFGDVSPVFLQSAMAAMTPERLEDVKVNGNFALDFVGALYVFAAYFIMAPQILVNVFNPQMMEIISNLITKRIIKTFREMTAAFIVLLNFSRSGCQFAYVKAAKHVKTLLYYKTIENTDGEEEEEEEEAEEDGDAGEEQEEIYREWIIPYKVPFDSFDAIAMFKEVSMQTGWYASLDPNLQNEINEIFNSLQPNL